MAKVNYNVVTHGVSGKVGDLLIFRQKHGKTFLGKIPTKGEPHANQLAVREKFLKAIRYAKRALKDLTASPIYKARAGNGVSPMNLAIGDFFNAPVISEIDLAVYTGEVGSKIEVLATDDIKVTGVAVSITAANGAVLEEGAAVDDETGSWIYTATAPNASLAGTKITATAKDLPGNTTTRDVVL